MSRWKTSQSKMKVITRQLRTSRTKTPEQFELTGTGVLNKDGKDHCDLKHAKAYHYGVSIYASLESFHICKKLFVHRHSPHFNIEIFSSLVICRMC